MSERDIDLEDTTRTLRRAPRVAAAMMLVLVVAACSGGAPTGDASSVGDGAVDVVPAASDVVPATTDEGPDGEDGLVGRLDGEAIEMALGERPEPSCKTSVLSGAESCVWMAADGSWLKIERDVQIETPTLEAFSDRMIETLGVDEPIDGLGQAAFRYASDDTAKVAAYLGDGLVIWVVLNRAVDARAHADEVVTMAQALVDGE